jgi:formylglycine-generating enzyme required for sulfatase activity
MVWIPSGRYRRGSPRKQPGRSKDEGPVFEVKIPKGFWVSAFEVTQAQYREVTGSNPSRFRGDQRPVERVSWKQARIFCMQLTKKERKHGRISKDWRYRLPSEAEWEYFARAGQPLLKSREMNSECKAPGLARLGWFCGNSATKDPRDHASKLWSAKKTPAHFSGTHRVGSRRPNAWGLFDVRGNVLEWCQDLYRPSYWEVPRNGRPAGRIGGRGDRVLRGGAWISDANSCRLTHRSHFPADLKMPTFGFRPVLALTHFSPSSPPNSR